VGEGLCAGTGASVRVDMERGGGPGGWLCLSKGLTRSLDPMILFTHCIQRDATAASKLRYCSCQQCALVAKKVNGILGS